jgi:hypothetical protein
MTPNHQEAPVATTPQYLKPLEAAKAYVALVGTIATALLAVFAGDETVGKVLTVIAVVATAIATYKVPNADPEPEFDEGNFYDGHGDF